MIQYYFMNLFYHELIHVVLSLLIAFSIWKLFPLKSKIYHLGSVIAASLLGGFFIDIDHLFDYILAFGIRFRLDYFFKGYQFLKSDKVFLPLHSWELVIFLLILSFILSKIYHLRSKIKLPALLLAFSLSLFFHLVVDMTVDNVTANGYSLVYRATHAFDLKYFVPSKHYQKHLRLKNEIRL